MEIQIILGIAGVNSVIIWEISRIENPVASKMDISKSEHCDCVYDEAMSSDVEEDEDVFEIGFFGYHFPIHLGNIKLSPIHIAVIILSAAAAAVKLDFGKSKAWATATKLRLPPV